MAAHQLRRPNVELREEPAVTVDNSCGLARPEDVADLAHFRPDASQQLARAALDVWRHQADVRVAGEEADGEHLHHRHGRVIGRVAVDQGGPGSAAR
eukprot:4984444-Prymnesium_polylepis.2